MCFGVYTGSFNLYNPEVKQNRCPYDTINEDMNAERLRVYVCVHDTGLSE